MPVGQHVASKAVGVRGLDLVGEVGEEDDVGEAELGQQLVRGRVGPGQLLMGLAEVRLQGVDGLQAHRKSPGR